MKPISTETYYDAHSDDYVSKWQKLPFEPDNPHLLFRKNMVDTAIGMLGVTAEDRVVDIGCGTGLVLRELASRTQKLVGIDSSLEMLRRAEKQVLEDLRVVLINENTSIPAERIRQIPAILLAHMHAHEEKLPLNFFDKAISIEVLRYIKDLDPVLANVKRFVKPGGRFVFTITNELSPSLFPLKFTVRRILKRIHEDELVHYFLTWSALERRLKTNGLHQYEVQPYGLFSAVRRFRGLCKKRKDMERLQSLEARLARVPYLRGCFDTFIVSVTIPPSDRPTAIS